MYNRGSHLNMKLKFQNPVSGWKYFLLQRDEWTTGSVVQEGMTVGWFGYFLFSLTQRISHFYCYVVILITQAVAIIMYATQIYFDLVWKSIFWWNFRPIFNSYRLWYNKTHNFPSKSISRKSAMIIKQNKYTEVKEDKQVLRDWRRFTFATNL